MGGHSDVRQHSFQSQPPPPKLDASALPPAEGVIPRGTDAVYCTIDICHPCLLQLRRSLTDGLKASWLMVSWGLASRCPLCFTRLLMSIRTSLPTLLEYRPLCVPDPQPSTIYEDTLWHELAEMDPMSEPGQCSLLGLAPTAPPTQHADPQLPMPLRLSLLPLTLSLPASLFPIPARSRCFFRHHTTPTSLADMMACVSLLVSILGISARCPSQRAYHCIGLLTFRAPLGPKK